MCAIIEDYALDQIKKVAQKMIRRGDSDEEIQEVTELSLDEIEELRSKE